MSKINIWHFCLIYLVFSTLCASNCLAAGGETGVASDLNTNTTSTTNTATTSDLNTNTINQNVLPYPASTFSSSSSFSGYSSFGNQCGLSISGGYINNGNQDAFQLISTFNTNPCSNQSDLEKLRQENESKRELIRANALMITTCINARIQAAQKDINPDIVCQLAEFQINFLPPPKFR